MAFTVEDGSGISSANAYIDKAFADTYHADQGHADWTGTDTEKETWIVRATYYIDKRFGRRFRGFRKLKSQSLEWPRLDAFDNDGFLLSGEDEVPRLLQRACAEYALRAKMYGVLAPDPPRAAPVQDPTDATTSSAVEAVASGVITEEAKKIGPLEKTTRYQSVAQMISSMGRDKAQQSSLINDVFIPEYPEADLWIEELLRSSTSRRLARA